MTLSVLPGTTVFPLCGTTGFPVLIDPVPVFSVVVSFIPISFFNDIESDNSPTAAFYTKLTNLHLKLVCKVFCAHYDKYYDIY